MLLVILASSLALAGLVALLSIAGTRRFRALYAAERAELLERGRQLPTAPPTTQAAANLPALVQDYLAAAGSSPRMLRVATLTQRGRLRAAADKPWMPFTAEQVYAFEPPGFVWLARARVAPLIQILARDKFVDGRGNMRINLLGLVMLADAKGHEMDLGAGLRYWGEIAAFPEALVSPYLRWQELSERRVRLDVEQGTLTMSAVLEFGADGLLCAMHAERYRDVDGTPVLTPWSGRLGAWTRYDGRLFPSEWQSVWHLPEGDFVAVEMQILSVRVEGTPTP